MRWSSAQPYKIFNAVVNVKHWLRGGQGGKILWVKDSHYSNSPYGVGELLYAAIFLKFAGVPASVALFTQMSQAVHGLVSQSDPG